jgi:hypothetical protein
MIGPHGASREGRALPNPNESGDSIRRMDLRRLRFRGGETNGLTTVIRSRTRNVPPVFPHPLRVAVGVSKRLFTGE